MEEVIDIYERCEYTDKSITIKSVLYKETESGKLEIRKEDLFWLLARMKQGFTYARLIQSKKRR